MSGIALYASVQAPGLDAIVGQHASLVKRIAYHLMSRLPSSVQVEDLIQAGMVGLLEAARQYDHAQGASFETYAGIRIRGAMLDELRRYDWTPRSVHRKARDVAEAMRSIEARTGRDARDAEVAEHLGLSLSEYHQVLHDSLSCRMFSFEELLEAGDSALDDCADSAAPPVEVLTQSGFAEALANAIAGLPERERLVISLYYEEELNLREIGEVLGVSESRVCQLQSQAMLRLRARMQGWLDAEQSAGARSKGRRKAAQV
ncbi:MULTISPECIES: RNA polymerase sigma factor FliA [Methylocaldum]|jgi:RNA polymerase sigma factor for flagellar operon FliA|uniref:RNA polymerase sigma factor FliA n=1 Tax=unclassified Methylocaldum TaxID=2622260 RepID=UPI00098AD3D6|nr:MULTISPECIES: RNA polymerase sigma factor FliA [unclassified Methylocaldum]MBP1149599.1 RNA polymerase sigma factor for flagellar operon FliA [Methylocaldum sp. RMAD-M]MDV3242515.1 RNA polymerase sigma factor FliA [Methylocaldum sp.]MVF20895.1 RNA polymerase sigma factor FliA [Methylocaldum sp. BRCS4]